MHTNETYITSSSQACKRTCSIYKGFMHMYHQTLPMVTRQDIYNTTDYKNDPHSTYKLV